MTKEEIRQVIEVFIQELTALSNEVDPEQSKKMLLGGKEATLDIILPRVQEKFPELPSDMDEAAEETSQSAYSEPTATGFAKRSFFKRGFKAGAEWMAGQYKTLGETEIYLEDDGGEEPYTQEWLDLATTEFAIPEGFMPGDKVEILIRKK